MEAKRKLEVFGKEYIKDGKVQGEVVITKITKAQAKAGIKRNTIPLADATQAELALLKELGNIYIREVKK